MKIVPYLKWHWKKIDIWNKCYFASLCLVPAGMFSPNPYNLIFSTLVLVSMSFLIGWLIKDHFKFSYGEFEKEQQKLIETIKNSDQK